MEEPSSDVTTRVVVLVAVVLAGFNYKLARGIPVAFIVMAAATPMWWRLVLRYEFTKMLLALSCVAIVSGFYLADISSSDYVISRLVLEQALMELLGGLAVLVAVLWGRALFPLHVVAVAYGSGDLADMLLFSTRSWKYHLALPVTIIVVGWLGRHRRQLPTIVALLVLGLLTALDRGRSFFAFCALAACIMAWQALPVAPTGRAHRWRPALLLVVIGLILYDLSINMLTSGYLGFEAQQRTIEQMETSGSLLLGGRFQWAATYALMMDRPIGYGLGVVPDTHQYAIVKTSLESINVHDDWYVRNYMLDGRFKLHSITADLWVRYGIAGLALAATIGFALIRTASTLIAHKRCPALVSLMVILGLWYLLFEPTFSYGNDLFFALGVTLLPRSRAERRDV